MYYNYPHQNAMPMTPYAYERADHIHHHDPHDERFFPLGAVALPAAFLGGAVLGGALAHPRPFYGGFAPYGPMPYGPMPYGYGVPFGRPPFVGRPPFGIW